jgi:predicted acetyltransferase
MLNKDTIQQKLALIVTNLDETSLQDLSDVLANLAFSENENVRLTAGWAVEEDNSQRLGFINIRVDTKNDVAETSQADCWKVQEKEVFV